jgi:hypothetical protein
VAFDTKDKRRRNNADDRDHDHQFDHQNPNSFARYRRAPWSGFES